MCRRDGCNRRTSRPHRSSPLHLRPGPCFDDERMPWPARSARRAISPAFIRRYRDPRTSPGGNPAANPVSASCATGSSPARDSGRPAGFRDRRKVAGRRNRCSGSNGRVGNRSWSKKPQAAGAKRADDVAIDPVEGESARAAGMALVAIGIGGQRNIGPPPPRHTELRCRRAWRSEELSATRKAAFSRYRATKRSCQRMVQGVLNVILRRDEIAPGKLLQQWAAEFERWQAGAARSAGRYDPRATFCSVASAAATRPFRSRVGCNPARHMLQAMIEGRLRLAAG